MGTSNLPFWKPSIQTNAEYGYIDTFKINNSCFRIVHITESDSATVEVLKKNRWDTLIIFENLGNHNDYDRKTDVNGDGFVDIIYNHQWSSEIYLYNPQKHQFEDSPLDVPSCSLLDKGRHIFYDYYEYKYSTSDSSQLFVLKGNQVVILFTLELILDKSNSEEEPKIKKVVLYDANQRKIKEIKINSSEFDYERFWKLNYKKLLGFG